MNMGYQLHGVKTIYFDTLPNNYILSYTPKQRHLVNLAHQICIQCEAMEQYVCY
jgi:hypothetical protein